MLALIAFIAVLAAFKLQTLGYTGTCTQGDDFAFFIATISSLPCLLGAFACLVRILRGGAFGLFTTIWFLTGTVAFANLSGGAFRIGLYLLLATLLLTLADAGLALAGRVSRTSGEGGAWSRALNTLLLLATACLAALLVAYNAKVSVHTLWLGITPCGPDYTWEGDGWVGNRMMGAVFGIMPAALAILGGFAFMKSLRPRRPQ